METELSPKYCNAGRLDHDPALNSGTLMTSVAIPTRDGVHKMTSDAVGVTHITDQSNSYVVESLLGKGGFAKVYKLKTSANQIFAGKIIHKKRISKSHNKDRVAREVDIHRRMKHENVVQFLRFFEDVDHVFIILEYCGTKTLSGILKVRKKLTEPEVRYYLKQIIAGCEHIHSQKIVHRDLKLSNLFINDQMIVKIGDFGLSAFIDKVDDKKESICGTPNYISPEVILKAGHSYPVDVWAIGCVIYALLAGRPPFETQCLKDTYKLIAKSRYTELCNASAQSRNLIAKCLKVNPLLRPSLHAISNDPFLTHGFMPRSLPNSAATSSPEFSANRNGENMLKGDDGLSTQEIDAVTYLIETIDSQEVCAQGGKNIDDGFVNSSVSESLYRKLQSSIESIKDKQESKNPKPVKGNQCLWITKWVDYSHKHGFGFQLSNNIYGAGFKDGASITISPDTHYVGFHDSEGTTLESHSSELTEKHSEKYQMMLYFVKYMNETLIKGGDLDHAPNTSNLSGLYMVKWLRTKQTIAMCLSSGTIQVNFLSDHTKLVVTQTSLGEYQLMYINSRRQASVFNLDDISNHGCTTDIKQRLKYSTLQLATMLKMDTSLQ